MSALSGLEGLINYCSMSYFDPKHGLLGLGFGLFLIVGIGFWCDGLCG